MNKTCLSLVIAATMLTGTVKAQSFYVAGDFNGWNEAGNLMTEMQPGIWQAALTGVSGRHEFKITDGTWSWSFPGQNSWFHSSAGGDVTITYDVNTYSDGWLAGSQRVGLDTDPGIWTAVGSFQGWDNANPTTAMSPMGGGIYKYTTVLTPGTYDWKAVVTGSWDSISRDARSVNTDNYSFTVDPGMELTSFYVDALKGTVKLEMAVVPEPATLSLLALGLGALFFRPRRG